MPTASCRRTSTASRTSARPTPIGAITREADRRFVRTERPRLVSYPCLDARGIWIGPNLDPGDQAVQLEDATQLDGPGDWIKSAGTRV